MFGNAEKIPNNEEAEKKSQIENPDYDDNKNIYTGDVEEAKKQAEGFELADDADATEIPKAEVTEASNDENANLEEVSTEGLELEEDVNKGHDPYNKAA